VRQLEGFGVELQLDLNSSTDLELKEIIEAVIEHRLVLIRGVRIPLNRFSYINEVWGKHQPTHIWATHAQDPKIIRVTNREVKDGRRGLFHGQELDWHCNGIFVPYPEQCVALWCQDPGGEGETEFACGVSAYDSLEENIKKKINDMEIIITNRISKTFLRKSVYGRLSRFERAELSKITSRVEHQGNIKHSEHEKLIDIKKKLVVIHPKSKKSGLYFPLFNIANFSPSIEGLEQKDLFFQLYSHYVGNFGIIYKHSWSRYDLILSDQIHSLHRRLPFTGQRELYRTSFWYH
jgi:alpha-ketoglutarate-dependent taurine dioxygenase